MKNTIKVPGTHQAARQKQPRPMPQASSSQQAAYSWLRKTPPPREAAWALSVLHDAWIGDTFLRTGKVPKELEGLVELDQTEPLIHIREFRGDRNSSRSVVTAQNTLDTAKEGNASRIYATWDAANKTGLAATMLRKACCKVEARSRWQRWPAANSDKSHSGPGEIRARLRHENGTPSVYYLVDEGLAGAQETGGRFRIPLRSRTEPDSEPTVNLTIEGTERFCEWAIRRIIELGNQEQ